MRWTHWLVTICVLCLAAVPVTAAADDQQRQNKPATGQANLPTNGQTVEQLTLFLDASVPYRSRTNKLIMRDAEVLLTVQADGALAKRGWAFIDGIGPVLSPVTITESSWDGTSLQVSATIELVHTWPARTGGSISFTVSATRKGRRLQGDYAVTSDGYSHQELVAEMREKLQRSTPPQRFRWPIGVRHQRQSATAASQRDCDGGLSV